MANFLTLTNAPLVLVGLLGLVVGSFLNVCIVRIPVGTFWSNHRSLCPHCGTQVPAWLNVPVLSYVFLRGRAQCCGTRLSLQYPLVELLTAGLFLSVYLQTPFMVPDSADAWLYEWQSRNFLRALHAWTFASFLIVASVIDLRAMIIPDVLSLPMLAASPIVAMVHPDLTLGNALVGAFAGAASLYSIAWIYWLIRREIGLGFGDVKLLAVIGGWMGYQAIIPTLLLASISGAIVGLVILALQGRQGLRTAIPFGPFLASGAMIHWMVGGEWIASIFDGTNDIP